MESYLITGAVVTIKSICIVSAIWVVVMIIFLSIGKKGSLRLRQFFIREWILSCYLATLFGITGLAGRLWSFDWGVSYNLIPFMNEEPVLMVLNTILFIPMGLLLPITFSIFRKLTRVAAAGLLLILLIETSQLIWAGRIFDIDDIIFNFIGVLIGYLFYRAVNMTKEKVDRKDSRKYGKGRICLLIASVGFFIGLPIQRITITDILLYQIGVNTLGSSMAYRLSALLPITRMLAGLYLGVVNRADRYAKEGIAISIMGLLICLIRLICLV